MAFLRFLNRNDVGLVLLGLTLLIFTQSVPAGILFITVVALLRWIGRQGAVTAQAKPQPQRPTPVSGLASVAVDAPKHEQGSIQGVFERLDPRWQEWIADPTAPRE